MEIAQNIIKVRQRIAEAEIAAHRTPGSVLLLAVSKQQNCEAIIEAFNQGIHDFGENYYQEAQDKIVQLKHLPITWHFIGPIQSNKTKGIAAHFNWVHSINRLNIAKLLNDHRSADLAPLNVCLQINLVEEETKSGISPQAAAELAYGVSQLPHLKLKGLMTIPPPQTNHQNQLLLLKQLTQLMHTINQELNLGMHTLSMGMSDDLVPAIEAGSTIVRIGRAIFGERKGKSL